MPTHRFSCRTCRRGSPVTASGGPRRGFTLTELLIVIAIIAVLASLITAAAVRAMYAARRGRIVMEINQLAGALEKFKQDRGDYPPNAFNPNPNAVNNPPSGTPAAMVQADFERMFKKAFPRHREPRQLILALCGQNVAGGSNQNLPHGMTAAEAVYFWLGGFSADEQFPVSGPGGPSFVNQPGGEVLESRATGYEFDLGRLGPRTDSGEFAAAPAGDGRFLLYQVDLNSDGDAADAGESRRINFWRYQPPGSDLPLVYFDTSRHKPYQYDPPAQFGTPIYALKKVREGFPASGTPTMGDLTFIDQKFQILHCGLDDEWGDFGQSATTTPPNPATTLGNQAVYPEGPFMGPLADTLSNFADGELAEAAEE
ncbi:MAG: hypothetical protein DCC67_10400 [Planctomycetota bacterium]|nr:MAG: hypothetical protein DCC67_10400 [Planctomycetota bacterium]